MTMFVGIVGEGLATVAAYLVQAGVNNSSAYTLGVRADRCPPFVFTRDTCNGPHRRPRQPMLRWVGGVSDPAKTV